MLALCPGTVGGGSPGIRSRLQVRSVRRQQAVATEVFSGHREVVKR